MSFDLQLREVKAAKEDFEWYPTTDAIIRALVSSMETDVNDRYSRGLKFLDIGAGNGKVINAVKDVPGISTSYAIEKSSFLLNSLPPEVFILGTDFWKTSLADKELHYVFSNPPYSQFSEWTLKILREIPPETTLYLVIPERWKNDRTLKEAMEERKQEFHTIGNFDFQNAEEREARAKVELVKITTRGNRQDANDPFVKFFEEAFGFPTDKPGDEEDDKTPFEEKVEATKLVRKVNFIEALCILYEERMLELQENYQAVCRLEAGLLEELGITKDSLIESLRMKISTLKKEYWGRLFDGMEEITHRLTHESRRNMLNILQGQHTVDFDRDNAYAIVLWAVKNANKYFDDQLVNIYEKMVERANIENYKSNKRVFTEQRFRYTYVNTNETTHIRLKVGHRIILTACGGLKEKRYEWDKGGLSSTAATFISDLITVANNLGYKVNEPAPREDGWHDNSAKIYTFTKNGKDHALFKLRTFLNSNIHIHFHNEFIHTLNSQHGKLKGWLRDSEEAAEELEISLEEASTHFKNTFKIEAGTLRISNSAEATESEAARKSREAA